MHSKIFYNPKEQASILPQMINLMPGHVFLKDTKGCYLGWNNRVFQTLSNARSISDLLGKNDYDLLGEHAAECVYNDKVVLSKKKELTIVENGFDACGKPACYLSKKVPVYNQHDDLLGILGFSMDVTHSENIKLAEAAVDQLSNQLIVQDNESVHLSKQQSQCLYYTLQGKSAKEIANAMQLSRRTVEDYINTIKIKLNCNKKSELITKALELGLLEIKKFRI